MQKMLQTLRFLSKGFTFLTVIGFLSILGSVIINEAIFYLTDRYDNLITARQTVTMPVPLEFTAGIFAMLIGLMLFVTNFKVALANGISRKTYLLANLPAAGLTAAAFSIFNIVFVLIYGLFRPVTLISGLFYPHTGWVGFFIFQFAFYFLVIAACWFIGLAYYRSSPPVRWAITFSPVGLYILYRMADARFGGYIGPAIDDYLHLTLRTPYTAATAMLAYTVILCALVYLLIRRTPLRS